MRTIKFRIFNKKIKSYIGIHSSAIMIDELNNLNDNLIVEQFTGLYDKNGKEIYEGDFITYSGITSNGQKIIRVVNYNSDYARFQGGMYPLSETKNLIEVIGNIYENRELLEK